MVMDNIWSQKKKRWDRWHLMTTWAWWISTPIIRMDAILILIENLNHVKHVQFFSKTCRGPEVTITFMVLLDNLRLISRYEETSYYGQSFHYIKWWMIWMTNMDGFMLFYERICLSVSHPYHGQITTIYQWEASAVWKGFPVQFATFVWPNWMVLKVLIHYYPYHWDEIPFRMPCFPTFAINNTSNWHKFSQDTASPPNDSESLVAIHCGCCCVCVWMS